MRITPAIQQLIDVYGHERVMEASQPLFLDNDDLGYPVYTLHCSEHDRDLLLSTTPDQRGDLLLMMHTQRVPEDEFELD